MLEMCSNIKLKNIYAKQTCFSFFFPCVNGISFGISEDKRRFDNCEEDVNSGKIKAPCVKSL